jgi:hypothetical protein
MPCTEKRARLLLERKRAKVINIRPFVIKLKDRLAEDSEFQPLIIKLDPVSKVTWAALVREVTPESVTLETEDSGPDVAVVNFYELHHRGDQIKKLWIILTFKVFSISRAPWLVMKRMSICWKSGIASVPIVGR